MATKVPATLLTKAQRWALGLIGLTVALMVGGSLLSSKDVLQNGVSGLPWEALGVLFVAVVAESLLRGWRYHTTGKALGLGVPLGKMLYYYTVGYGLIPTPGKVGTAIRLWMLKTRHNLPYSRTASLLVMDFVTDALAIFALCALALLLLPDPHFRVPGLLLAIGLVVGVASVLAAPRVLGQVLKIVYWLTGKRKKRLFAKVLKLIRITHNTLGPKLLGITILQSFVGWGLVGLATAYVVTAFGTPLTPAQGMATAMLSNIGGFISLMPAGVGGAEVSMTGLLTYFGTPLSTALLITALWRLIVTWLCVILGLVLLPFALRKKA